MCTPHGVVRATQVIVATDAYGTLTNATSRYARLMIPFRTAAIATERLPGILYDRLMVNERAYNETRRMMKWFRKVNGRVFFGGRRVLGKETAHEFYARQGHSRAVVIPLHTLATPAAKVAAGRYRFLDAIGR